MPTHPRHAGAQRPARARHQRRGTVGHVAAGSRHPAPREPMLCVQRAHRGDVRRPLRLELFGLGGLAAGLRVQAAAAGALLSHHVVGADGGEGVGVPDSAQPGEVPGLEGRAGQAPVQPALRLVGGPRQPEHGEPNGGGSTTPRFVYLVCRASPAHLFRPLTDVLNTRKAFLPFFFQILVTFQPCTLSSSTGARTLDPGTSRQKTNMRILP